MEWLYYAPTVVQPTIPNADMTPLELLLLSSIFDAEPDGDGWYFSADECPADMIWLSRTELESALAESSNFESEASTYIEKCLADASESEAEIELDLSITSWEFIFQSIVRRSATLTYITAVASFTCSKMRPDGFGGMAVLITADVIKGKSTEDILHDFLDEAEYGPLGTAPGFGIHILLRLEEKEVREAIPGIIETDPNLTALSAEAITDNDIREGCLVVAERADMTEERGSVVFRAALAAIRLANMRSSRPG
jgi:hypothetical protein